MNSDLQVRICTCKTRLLTAEVRIIFRLQRAYPDFIGTSLQSVRGRGEHRPRSRQRSRYVLEQRRSEFDGRTSSSGSQAADGSSPGRRAMEATVEVSSLFSSHHGVHGTVGQLCRSSRVHISRAARTTSKEACFMWPVAVAGSCALCHVVAGGEQLLLSQPRWRQQGRCRPCCSSRGTR